MINPNLKEGRFLFKVDWCDRCKIYESFIYKFNFLLKPNKRIKIKDCSLYDKTGISTDPIILLFAPYIDFYPTIFIDGRKIEGANSVLECISRFKTELFNDFIFPQENEYLPTINQYEIFNKQCDYRKGKLVCKEAE